MGKIDRSQLELHGYRYWLLLVCMLAVAAPHVARIPIWVSLVFALLVGLHYFVRNAPLRRGKKFILLLLTLAGSAGILLEYSSLFSQRAGVALLLLMLALKLFEVHRIRDLMLVLFLGYFVVITNFLTDQSIGMAIYLFGIVILITATLIAFSHQSKSMSFQKDLWMAVKLLAQSLPLMLVLFLLFPRLPGPLWGLPNDAISAKTGLSDSMEMGTFGGLAQSDEIAFRVEFPENIPPQEQRYWRGPIFWYSDGQRWTEGLTQQESQSAVASKSLSANPVLFNAAGTPITQDITLEPSHQRWLMALDMPASVSIPAQVSIAGNWETNDPIARRIRYRAISYPQYNTGDLSPLESHLGLQLPERISPRVIALVKDWKKQNDAAEKIAQTALLYFHDQPFQYSLTPPPTGGDPLDEFLFETRSGFCEHYASTFTLLMRIAGIPARVVTGYQGGEENRVGKYLVVRQLDAHAWSEVWIQNRGWVRVDPTGAVAPERINQPVNAEYLQRKAAGSFLFGNAPRLYQTWAKAKQILDAVNNGWNQWVIGYRKDQQESLLKSFGFEQVGWKELAWSLTIGLIMATLVTSAWLFSSVTSTKDPVQRGYEKFCRRLTNIGLSKLPNEGPKEFSQRAARQRPDIADRIWVISELYMRLRYGPLARSTHHVLQFRDLVRGFRPARERR